MKRTNDGTLGWVLAVLALILVLLLLNQRAFGQTTNLSQWLEQPAQAGDTVQVNGVVSSFEAMLHFAGLTKEQIAILLLMAHCALRVLRNTALKNVCADKAGWFKKALALAGGKPLDANPEPSRANPLPVTMVASSPIPIPPRPGSDAAGQPPMSLSTLTGK